MLQMAEEVTEGFSMHIFHSLKQVSLFRIMSSLSWLVVQNNSKNHQKAQIIYIKVCFFMKRMSKAEETTVSED